jgi:T1SS-143 domain-containing protein
MPTSAQVPGGVVSHLQGRANVIPSGGKEPRPLQEGDVIAPGDVIHAEQGTEIQIRDGAGQDWLPSDMQVAMAGADQGTRRAGSKAAKSAGKHADDDRQNVEEAIRGLNDGKEDAATAAGIGAGGGGSMGLGLRVDRVIEAVSPQEFTYDTAVRDTGTPFTVTAAPSLGEPSQGNRSPVIDDPANPNFKPTTGRYEVQTEEDKPVSGQVRATDPDGDTLTYGKGSDPQHGSVVIRADGSWTYTPNKDYNGADAFTVAVSDGKGGLVTAIVDVGITPVNDPPKVGDPGDETFDPVAGKYVLTTDEDTPVTGRVGASDVDGDVLSFGPGQAPQHGTVVIQADGSWTYTPDRDYNGPDAFTVLVSDGKGGTATAVVEIGVQPVNDAPKVVGPDDDGSFDPVAQQYLVDTLEDTPVSGQVTATDADGDALTYTPGTAPQHGTVIVNADGTWTYTPNADYTGFDTFTVKVDDGHGGTAIASVKVGVAPDNDPPKIDDPENPDYDPIAGKYVVSTDEDTPVSGHVRATDGDGDALSYGPGVAPTHGTVVVNADGTWTYTPAKDYNGTDSFTVTVSDGAGGTASALVEVGIQPVNDAPKVVDPDSADFDPITGQYTVGTEEDTPVSGQVKATDADGDVLSYALGNAPAHGSVAVNVDGSWTYTPSADYAGPDVFTVMVDDGHGGTALATVNIGVGASNDPPKIDDPDNPDYDPITGKYVVSTDEDVPVSGRVAARDSDGDALTYSPGLVPAHGTVVVNSDGTWTYTPTKDYNGPDAFTVTVSDGRGGTATATVEIGIQAVNDAPKVVDPDSADFDPITGQYTVNTEEDTPVSGQVKATDVDGDVLSYALSGTPQHGTVTVNADGTWTYTPSADYAGSDVFTVMVDDGHGGTALATVNIGVGASNDPPKIDDPDNPDYDPIAGKYVVSTDEDVPVSGRVTASDSDGDALTYSSGLAPVHGAVEVNSDGTWTYTPAKDYNGPDSFTVTVNDGKGGTATAMIEVGIQAVNDAPKVVDPDSNDFDPITGQYTVNTDEDTPVSGQVKATDVDGDVLSYTLGNAPAHGSVTININGTWTYTPATDYAGSDVFTVKVDDGHGGTALATVNIGVGASNDPPKLTDPEDGSFDPETGKYTASTDEDTPVSGRVTATDSDGDALTFAPGLVPAHGTVVVNSDGTWTYTPAKDYNGSDSFTVTVSDGKGGIATATVDIGIQAVNDAPKVVDPDSNDFDPITGQYTVNTDEDTPVSGQVKATDVDGDALSYTLGNAPTHGTVTVNADGTWTYTPSKDYAGTDIFTVKVDDGHGGTALATVNIGVGASNDPPKLTDPEDGNFDPQTGQYTVATLEDTPVSGQVAASDADGDELTFAQGLPPAHGTVTVNADGNWTYTPSKDYNGLDAFTVTVSDGKGGITTAAIQIGIQPVNDAPVIGQQLVPAHVSEEGLADGNADNQGTSDTGNSKVAEGQVAISDVEGNLVHLTLSGPSGLSSGGVAVTWSGSGTSTDPLVGMAGGKPVLNATIDDQGHYKFTLLAPVDHTDTTVEDLRTISFQIRATDGRDIATSTLTLNVEDDSPLSGTQVMKVDSSTGSQNTNLMLIIDTSGSMKEELADKTANGIKAAIKSLIDRYDDIGDVKIQIVTFNDAGQGRASWLTVAQAKTFVDALNSADGTNYDAALAAAKASFASPGKLADGVNVSYFITDGQPSRGKGLDSGDETTWEKFVTDNRIDSYAIGTGTLTSQHISNIQPIAYDGIDRTEKPAVTLTNNKDLSQYLLDTVPTVKSGSIASLAGADGLHSIEAFGSSKQVSSSLNGSTKVLTLTLQSGAEIKLNTLTGEFTMKQGREGGDEAFNYTIVDKDGDRSSGTLILSGTGTPEVPAVNHAPKVFAVNEGHNILDLVDLSVNPLLDLSKEQRVAVQDSDNNLVRVDVSVDQLLSIGSLLGDKSELHVSHDSGLTHGLKISGDGTRHLVIESETSGGTIDVTQINKVLATLSYDPASIFGIVSVDLFPKLTIKAMDSAGASDSKTISSSIVAVDVDVPLLSSSSLKASVDHQSDHDVFAWSLADAPTSSGTHHVDTISDFNGASPTSGGDVLDLRDLLHVDSGANAGANSVDKLLNFLDFDTQSQPGSTVIHVSANGGFQADTVHGDSSSAGVADQQHIVLSNVDIRASLGLDAQANDHQIIAELVQRGKLLVDNC